MKPYVICHMLMSIDGIIVTSGWKLSPEGRAEYETTGSLFNADAWMCGRITMAAFARGTAPSAKPQLTKLERNDYIAAGDHRSFAIALDASGKLHWETNEIGGDHLVTVLTENVSADYLNELQERDISYLFAGRESVDPALALNKLADKLPIKTLLLEGGGKINGSMLQAGLIDELSILIAPVTDSSVGTPTLFDLPGAFGTEPEAVRWKLKKMEQRADDIIWLRYARS